jgi:hypothetical protein
MKLLCQVLKASRAASGASCASIQASGDWPVQQLLLCCLSTLQAKQLVLELSQPVAAICYTTADRSMISKQGKAAAAALLEKLPDVLG